MNINVLYQVMNDVSQLSSMTEEELRQMVRQFPYFQAARKLLMRKLRDDDSLAFDRELKKSSVYIGDRAKLYFYLNTASTNGAKMDSALPELSLITTDFRQDETSSMSSSAPVDSGFNYLFLSDEEAHSINKGAVNSNMQEGLKEVVGESDKEQDLIDKFVVMGAGKIKPPVDTEEAIVNLAKDSVRENPAILTETLANIYIKQKKYDKAIDIFNSLCLKFPDKSGYFAAQIKELDLLIKLS